MAPPIGVVAIGRNEGERLVRCLGSISGLRLPIIYVDSGSTDGSVATARETGAEVVALDLNRPFTAARARAEGVAQLLDRFPETTFVMFVDGDCEIEPGWLTTASGFLADHPDFAVACGRRRERFPDASFYNRLMDAEWNTPPGEAEACGGDSLVRVAAYQAVGGFNPAIIAGEEPELCSRLRTAGWRIMRLDVPMTIHDAAIFRFGQWWGRAVRSGFGYAQAWSATRSRGRAALYRRELLRAIAWAGLLPLASLVAAVLVTPVALLLWPLLAGVQWLRLALRTDARRAWPALIGRFAELSGMLRYVWRASRGGAGGTLAYK